MENKSRRDTWGGKELGNKMAREVQASKEIMAFPLRRKPRRSPRDIGLPKWKHFKIVSGTTPRVQCPKTRVNRGGNHHRESQEHFSDLYGMAVSH